MPCLVLRKNRLLVRDWGSGEDLEDWLRLVAHRRSHVGCRASGHRIEDEAAHVLVSLLQLRASRIETLDISGSFGVTGAEAIASQLPSLTALRTLSVKRQTVNGSLQVVSSSVKWVRRPMSQVPVAGEVA